MTSQDPRLPVLLDELANALQTVTLVTGQLRRDLRAHVEEVDHPAPGRVTGGDRPPDRAEGGATMTTPMPAPTPAVQRVRELVVGYRPFRCQLPVEGTVSGRRDAAKLAAAILAGADVERVLALHFNVKHRFIGVHVVSVGTLDASLVHPRDVFKAACLSNAAASGDATPSGEDRALSDRLRQAGELLGVELLDFVIVTDPAEGVRYHSFKESGVL